MSPTPIHLLFFFFVAALLLSLSTALPVEPALDKRQFCPALAGTNINPSLVQPISKNFYSLDYTANNIAQFTPNDLATIYDFYFPLSAAGKTCTWYFVFPLFNSYVFTGLGNFDWSFYLRPAGSATTYQSQPGIASNIGVRSITPGQTTIITTQACPSAVLGGIVGNTTDSTLSYLQASTGCPMGLFVLVT